MVRFVCFCLLKSIFSYHFSWVFSAAKQCENYKRLLKVKEGNSTLQEKIEAIMKMMYLVDSYKACNKRWIFTAYCNQMLIETPLGRQIIEDFKKMFN